MVIIKWYSIKIRFYDDENRNGQRRWFFFMVKRITRLYAVPWHVYINALHWLPAEKSEIGHGLIITAYFWTCTQLRKPSFIFIYNYYFRYKPGTAHELLRTFQTLLYDVYKRNVKVSYTLPTDIPSEKTNHSSSMV